MMYKTPALHLLTVLNGIKHRLHKQIEWIPKKQAVRKEINFAHRQSLLCVWVGMCAQTWTPAET